MSCERCQEKQREINALRDEIKTLNARVAVLQLACDALRGPAEEKMLTTEDVAKALQLSPAHVVRIIKKGKPRAARFGENSPYRIRYADLTAFIGRSLEENLEIMEV